MNTATCRLCAHPIVWMRTRDGKWVPVEPASYDPLHPALTRNSEGKPIFSSIGCGHILHFAPCRVNRRVNGRDEFRDQPREQEPGMPRDIAGAYEALQVIVGAHPSVVRAAYRALSMLHHPDRNPSDGEKMRAINVALDVLRRAGRAE